MLPLQHTNVVIATSAIRSEPEGHLTFLRTLPSSPEKSEPIAVSTGAERLNAARAVVAPMQFKPN
jgi:hypothetical protein